MHKRTFILALLATAAVACAAPREVTSVVTGCHTASTNTDLVAHVGGGAGMYLNDVMIDIPASVSWSGRVSVASSWYMMLSVTAVVADVVYSPVHVPVLAAGTAANAGAARRWYMLDDNVTVTVITDSCTGTNNVTVKLRLGD